MKSQGKHQVYGPQFEQQGLGSTSLGVLESRGLSLNWTIFGDFRRIWWNLFKFNSAITLSSFSHQTLCQPVCPSGTPGGGERWQDKGLPTPQAVFRPGEPILFHCRYKG